MDITGQAGKPCIDDDDDECSIKPAYTQRIEYPRATIASDNDFRWDLTLTQVSPGVIVPFVHIDVYKWTPGVLRKLKSLWLSHRKFLPVVVLAQGDVTDKKWEKFVRQFGFEPTLLDCPCTDGTSRHIFAHIDFNRLS